MGDSLASLPDRAKGAYAFKVMNKIFASETECVRAFPVGVGASALKDS